MGRLDYASEGSCCSRTMANSPIADEGSVPCSKDLYGKGRWQPTPEALAKLRAGLSIRRRGRRVRTAPAKIQIIKESDNPWYEITLIEGRNRQIRRMFEEVGHHVEKIKRVRYGPLELDVHPGEYRRLNPKEVEQLRIRRQEIIDPRMTVLPCS